jgi:hypothetical protein
MKYMQYNKTGFNKSLDLTRVKDTSTMTYYHTDNDLSDFMGGSALTDLKHIADTAYVSYNSLTKVVTLFVDEAMVLETLVENKIEDVPQLPFIRVIGKLYFKGKRAKRK